MTDLTEEQCYCTDRPIKKRSDHWPTCPKYRPDLSAADRAGAGRRASPTGQLETAAVMTDLTEFLLARIAEDEEAARRANGETWHHRSLMRHPTSPQSVYGDSHDVAEVEHLYGWHIARHDPARVLAECEAKRRLIDGLVKFMEEDYAPWNEDFLRLLAVPYADHPDYRQEWKP